LGESATSKAKPKKGHLLRNVLIVFFAILISFAAVSSSPAIVFFNVTVSGTVHVAASGATPDNVVFVDENQVPYVAQAGPGGSYSISLMNGHTFTVTVEYSLAGKSAGYNCTAATLDLNALGYGATYDPSC
jgi:hypothetical protein